MTVNQNTERIGKIIAGLVDEIEKLFVDGAIATVIVRNPLIKDAEMLVTKDDVSQVIKALKLFTESKHRPLDA